VHDGRMAGVLLTRAEPLTRESKVADATASVVKAFMVKRHVRLD